MFSATAPAMPTSFDPAPAMASAPKVCTVSPPTLVMVDSRSRPLEVMVSLPIDAWLTTLTRLMETPTPTATLEACTAWPLLSTVPSVFAEDLRVSAPPALMVRPSGMVAEEVVLATLIATAAATDTEPSDVEAFGVLPELDPSPPPPLSESVLSALLRSPLTWLLTSPELLWLLSGAPLVEAVACADWPSTVEPLGMVAVVVWVMTGMLLSPAAAPVGLVTLAPLEMVEEIDLDCTGMLVAPLAAPADVTVNEVPPTSMRLFAGTACDSAVVGIEVTVPDEMSLEVVPRSAPTVNQVPPTLMTLPPGIACGSGLVGIEVTLPAATSLVVVPRCGAVDDPKALRLTAPPAVRLRPVVAVTLSLTRLRASATPTAAELAPVATAPALVPMAAVWVALAVKLPPSVVVPLLGSVPSVALVVTLESVTATAGVTA